MKKYSKNYQKNIEKEVYLFDIVLISVLEWVSCEIGADAQGY